MMETKSSPFQFSLRSLLLVITVAALVFSWWAFQWQRLDEEETLLKPLRRHGAQITRDGLSRVSEIEFRRPSGVSNKDLGKLKHFVHLQRLTLMGSEFTDAALANIEGLNRLEYLSVWLVSPDGRELTDEGLSHVGKLTSLRSLKYSAADVSNAGLRYVAQLRSLEELKITCPRATDAGLEVFSELGQLERLSLLWCDRITGTGLEALPRPEILDWLSLSHVTDEGMKTISRFSGLTLLSIGGPDLTAEGLSYLSEFKRLELLTISESVLDTGALERAVSVLPDLKELRLVKCPLEEADREPLRRLERSGVAVTETEY